MVLLPKRIFLGKILRKIIVKILFVKILFVKILFMKILFMKRGHYGDKIDR